MQTLLLDNYDSYTYNLFQLIAKVSGSEPAVVRNDECSWRDLARLEFDCVVISPGPGTPRRTRDFGVCTTLLRETHAPTLGVCLGHQGLGAVCGGRIVPAQTIMHGRSSRIRHSGTELFEGLPQGFSAVRYHSLVLSAELPSQLEATAWAGDGAVMGIRHRDRPLWGVQFHPESVWTEHGERLLANFIGLARKHSPAPARRGRPQRPRPTSAARGSGARPSRRALRPEVRRAGPAVDAERAFERLFGDSPYAFWLDSSAPGGGSGRFSFMGAASERTGSIVRYRVDEGVELVGSDGSAIAGAPTIFDYLGVELDRHHCAPAAAPFDFAGGFVGYLGYELKADCGAGPGHPSPLPDAQFLFVDRFLALDHREGTAYLVHLKPVDANGADDGWLERTERALADIRADPSPNVLRGAGSPPPGAGLSLSRTRPEYLADIAHCKERLAIGDAYEICLTNRLRTGPCSEPFELYRRLRALNPAPYAAYLRFGDLAILSSSPERFLRIGPEGEVEARPIKGTAARGPTPREDRAAARRLRDSAKERAENLMIVDLLRNDLGAVCEVGSIHVPRMMEIETYETVHQLVSTVRGRLRWDVGPVDCVRAAFPGGSMTGAPKLRAMEIIDELEPEPRGVYSGALGYLSLDGAADLSIVIRTIVSAAEETTIGAGGAIVIDSDPEREFEEMLLKARAPLRAALGDERPHRRKEVPRVTTSRSGRSSPRA